MKMNGQINKRQIAENITALAKWYGFRIKDIEAEAGVSPGYLSRMANKNSQDSNPIIDLLMLASRKFHVSVDSLMSMDFKKMANQEKRRLQLFFETLLSLSNRGQLSWERNTNREINKEEYSAGFVCRYDKNIGFYIFEEDNTEEEYPAYSFFISNRDEVSKVTRINLPGPALYETLRQLFETAAAGTELVAIGKSAESAIRKFMADNNLKDNSAEDNQKYRPLYEYLEQRSDNDIVLTFYEVEDILGFPLPQSAWKHHQFWENSKTGNSQCRSWMDAGYRTIDISNNTLEHRVHLRKTEN